MMSDNICIKPTVSIEEMTKIGTTIRQGFKNSKTHALMAVVLRPTLFCAANAHTIARPMRHQADVDGGT
jgi:hypothetical protein